VIIINKIFNECYAEIGSLTLAMKARAALASAAIPSEVIKTQGPSLRGCIYGISFSCQQNNNARTVLANSRIPVKRFEDGDM
jgi:hypothetical protein